MSKISKKRGNMLKIIIKQTWRLEKKLRKKFQISANVKIFVGEWRGGWWCKNNMWILKSPGGALRAEFSCRDWDLHLQRFISNSGKLKEFFFWKMKKNMILNWNNFVNNKIEIFRKNTQDFNWTYFFVLVKTRYINYST